MCNRLRIDQRLVTPGMELQYRILTAIRNGTWGMTHGLIKPYNARLEKLHSYWIMYANNRGAIVADSFEEKGYEFEASSGKLILPVIFNDKSEFAIITTESTLAIMPVHHRMPVILSEQGEQLWVREGNIILDALATVRYKTQAA